MAGKLVRIGGAAEPLLAQLVAEARAPHTPTDLSRI